MWWVRWPVTDLFHVCLCLFTYVHVCLCLFTYVWSLDLFWKLYIVPMLRELTSLSFNINHDTPINISFVWGRWLGGQLTCWAQVCTWEPVLTMGELIITQMRRIIKLKLTQCPLHSRVGVWTTKDNIKITHYTHCIPELRLRVMRWQGIQAWNKGWVSNNTSLHSRVEVWTARDIAQLMKDLKYKMSEKTFHMMDSVSIRGEGLLPNTNVHHRGD